MVEKYNIRTDLALEEKERFESDHVEVQGVILTEEYDEENEDAYIDLRKANEGWEPIGTYYFSSDTVRVVLTNECKLRSVTADAVKIVKRY